MGARKDREVRGTPKGGKHEEEGNRDGVENTGAQVAFSGLALCARREEAGIQPTLGVLGHPAIQFGQRENGTRQVAKKPKQPCHLFKTQQGRETGPHMGSI